MLQKIKAELKELKELVSKINPLLMTFFVLSVVLMNLLANKSIDLSWVPGNSGSYPWLALDCGILVSWMAFFTMDIVVRRFGPKASTRLTVIAVGINLVVCSVFLLAGTVGGFWGESYIPVGGEIVNTALDNTISGTWYVLMGSTVAFIASALVHGLTSTAVSKLFKDKEGLKSYAFCSFAATSLGQFTDNMIFSLIVSYNFFGWNLLQCVMCSLTGMFIEFILSVVFVPLGHKIFKKTKTTEQIA